VDIDCILARIAGGDRNAFAEIVAVYQRPLYAFLGRLGLTRDAATDIAQETFVRAWRNLDQYIPERAAFSTWLFSIARNLALSELARSARARERSEGTLTGQTAFEHGPHDDLAADQSTRKLRAALERLELTERTALALFYVRDLSLAEIAGLEGATVGAVKVRLHRARSKLRELLEDELG